MLVVFDYDVNEEQSKSNSRVMFGSAVGNRFLNYKNGTHSWVIGSNGMAFKIWSLVGCESISKVTNPRDFKICVVRGMRLSILSCEGVST